MENASKALIIAGAILLAILIISLGILIYNQASSVVTDNSMDEVAISTFNNKFTNYAGSQRGSTVRALVQQVNASNAAKENASRQITLSGVSDISSIDTGAMYTVKIEYSTSGSNNGLVNKITISAS